MVKDLSEAAKEEVVQLPLTLEKTLKRELLISATYFPLEGVIVKEN